MIKKLPYIAASLAGVGIITLSAVGVASAATTGSTNANLNVGTSGIPKTVFRQDRLDAAAEVLGTTTTAVQTAHKDKTFSRLLANAGLTKKTYSEKVRAELTTELEGQGYSQDQITIALQHRSIRHLRHHHEKDAS